MKLDEKSISDELNKIDDWILTDSKKGISKNYSTKNFVEAVNAINKIKDLSEKADHHPDIHLTGYRNLTIELSTHSEGGLTNKDFDLAAEIDKLEIKLKQ